MKRPFVRRALAGMAITLLVLAGCARTGSDAGAATASAPITPALIPAPATLQAGEGSFVINAGTRRSATGEPATRVAGQFAAAGQGGVQGVQRGLRAQCGGWRQGST